MNFRIHSTREGQHAILSPSQYAWLNYDDDKLLIAIERHTAKIRGTQLHALAKDCIRNSIALAYSDTDIQQQTMAMYVNDCIQMRMSPEVVLEYSPNAFGTADAIRFDNNQLYIFDLKTGITKASMRQLEVYAAFFAMEYDVDPYTFSTELRIYQSGEVRTSNPSSEDINAICERVRYLDARINFLREEATRRALSLPSMV